jgi:hypothetical protein
MFVTPPLAGGERKRRAFILSFPRLQEWQEATWPLPARIAATDGQAAAADERAPRATTLGLRTENRRSPLTTHAIRGAGLRRLSIVAPAALTWGILERLKGLQRRSPRLLDLT